jgi:hypothetical protein
MPCPFKKYAEVFGTPNAGVHKYRFANVAVVDMLITMAAAIVISMSTTIPLTITIIGLLLLAILAHTLFGVNTPTQRFLGLTC